MRDQTSTQDELNLDWLAEEHLDEKLREHYVEGILVQIEDEWDKFCGQALHITTQEKKDLIKFFSEFKKLNQFLENMEESEFKEYRPYVNDNENWVASNFDLIEKQKIQMKQEEEEEEEEKNRLTNELTLQKEELEEQLRELAKVQKENTQGLASTKQALTKLNKENKLLKEKIKSLESESANKENIQLLTRKSKGILVIKKFKKKSRSSFSLIDDRSQET